jgi:hypothetical protein
MNHNLDERKKNLIAQWAFDTRPILGRFHLWLEDIKVNWINAKGGYEPVSDLNDIISFVDARTERLLIMTAAVTALGTKLFGRFGEGANLDKKGLNKVKKDADAISAYAMSESLWYLSRSIPENHAIMVCLGEGLMPKAGETIEMGANPLLGFGRIYARPQVAMVLEGLVQKLINKNGYTWDDFRNDINHAGITVWGAAIDTLENTSRFAKGTSTGPMTILHLFNQPLAITDQYEGYIGNLILPKEIVKKAADYSILINYFTPRKIVYDAIKLTYPEIKPENVHVWTLCGKGREPRIGKLWDQWRNIGVHLVDDEWEMPTGIKPFTESGTYAPTYMIKSWKDDSGETHLFLTDGYAASAEAIQAASLSPILDLYASLSVFTSKFKLSYDKEPEIMSLDPEAADFEAKLSSIFGKELEKEVVETFRDDIVHVRDAGIPTKNRTITENDFISEKKWSVMALSGYMLPDPYSGAPGVVKISDDTYEVSVRLSTNKGEKLITFALKLLENFEESRLVFQPLLNRFLRGEDYKSRAVKISDSGRIRNELQTLCSVALEHYDDMNIKIYFDRIPEDIIPVEEKKVLREILEWYKEKHQFWFNWLEID